MPTITDASRRIPAGAIRSLMTDAFCACGLPQSDATTVAGAMLEADLSGSDAHGIFRLPGYVRTLKRGHINPRANIRVIERASATALVDGDNGMGHLVVTYAAIPVARGMIGIYTAVSGSNFMAPWGGAEPLLGTNPIAVGIPAGEHPPVMLDIATSVVSNGAIRTYAAEGKPMPEGWVMSRQDGGPITDGSRLSEGMFVPIAGYKGSGLALVLGLLGGPLNRAAFGRDVKDLTADQVRETNTGHVVIALDVARFRPLDEFTEEIGRHLGDLASSKRLPGFDQIHIPGQGRAARRVDRIRNGVPLSETLLIQVDETARLLGIKPLAGRIANSE